MKDNDSAFPVFDSARGEMDYQCIDPGMTIPQYAAIHLKVPRSGDPEIDAMIRESRRADFAGKALSGMMSTESHGISFTSVPEVVKRSFAFADAMIAEWEKTK
jgi:hypothetical protein